MLGEGSTLFPKTSGALHTEILCTEIRYLWRNSLSVLGALTLGSGEGREEEGEGGVIFVCARMR